MAKLSLRNRKYIGIIILLQILGVTPEDYFILDVCGYDDNFTIATCSALNLTELPSNDLEELKELYFTGNSITCIRNSEFQDYPSLQLLDLAQNKISKIEQHAFHNLTYLEYLLLTENNISHISPLLFIQNNFLKKLYLNENPLVLPSKSAFLESKSITYLDISFCNLTNLSEGIFDSLTQLQVVRLDGNPLTIIDGNIFKHLSNLKEIYMKHTFNSCTDPQLIELENYFTTHNVDYYGIYNCADHSTTTTVYYTASSFQTSDYPSIVTSWTSPDCICSVCWCSEGYDVYADCTSRNIEQMPTNNLTTLYHLDLSNNNISYIKNTYWINSRTLVILELTNNAIEELNENSFQYLASLEYLDLSSNKISNLQPLLFNENKMLTDLYLARNPLKIPSQSSIVNSKTIKLLDLSFCNLTILPDDTFQGLPQLTILILNGNHIIRINPIVVENLNYLKEVHLKMTNIPCMITEFNKTMILFSVRGISYFGPELCDSEMLITTTATYTTTSTNNGIEIHEITYFSTVESITTSNMGITTEYNISIDKSEETTENSLLSTPLNNGTEIDKSEVPSQNNSSKTINNRPILLPVIYLFHLWMLLVLLNF